MPGDGVKLITWASELNYSVYRVHLTVKFSTLFSGHSVHFRNLVSRKQLVAEHSGPNLGWGGGIFSVYQVVLTFKF